MLEQAFSDPESSDTEQPNSAWDLLVHRAQRSVPIDEHILLARAMSAPMAQPPRETGAWANLMVSGNPPPTVNMPSASSNDIDGEWESQRRAQSWYQGWFRPRKREPVDQGLSISPKTSGPTRKPKTWAEIVAAGAPRQPGYVPPAGSSSERESKPPVQSPLLISLRHVAQEASVLLEVFSRTMPIREEDVNQEHLQTVSSAAGCIQRLETGIRLIGARGNENVGCARRPGSGMDADCIICYSEIANTVFMPCKHLAVCGVGLCTL